MADSDRSARLISVIGRPFQLNNSFLTQILGHTHTQFIRKYSTQDQPIVLMPKINRMFIKARAHVGSIIDQRRLIQIFKHPFELFLVQNLILYIVIVIFLIETLILIDLFLLGVVKYLLAAECPTQHGGVLGRTVGVELAFDEVEGLVLGPDGNVSIGADPGVSHD